jgi:hypothetical protein
MSVYNLKYPSVLPVSTQFHLIQTGQILIDAEGLQYEVTQVISSTISSEVRIVLNPIKSKGASNAGTIPMPF